MEEMLTTVTDGLDTARTIIDNGINTTRTVMGSGFDTAKDFARTGLISAKGVARTGLDTAKGNVFNFFNSDRTTTRKKLLNFGAIVFMAGIIIGFLFSPIKKGFYFNISNNGNGRDDEDDDN